MKFEAEIRGMHFRLKDPVNPAPAKLLVESLATGAKLELVREPGNEYDPNAVQVWMPQAALPEGWNQKGGEFEIKLAGFGWTLEMVEAAPELMLGFVGKEFAEHISPLMEEENEFEATFAVSGKGKPLVKVDFINLG